MALKSSIPGKKTDTAKKDKKAENKSPKKVFTVPDDLGGDTGGVGRAIHHGDGISASTESALLYSGRFKGDLGGGAVSPELPPEKKFVKPPAADYPYHGLSPRKEQRLRLPEVDIEGADAPAAPQKFDWISVVLQPLGGLVAVVVLLFLMKDNIGSAVFMLVGAISGVLGILWGILRYNKQEKDGAAGTERNEDKYRAYLSEKRNELRRSRDEQLKMLNAESPAGSACAAWDENTAALWSVGIESSDFLRLRLGTGQLDNAQKIQVPQSHYKEENPLNEEARELAESFRLLRNAPVCASLRQGGSLGIVGNREEATALCRSLLVQSAALHSYEELKIVLVGAEKEKKDWEQLRFLPHLMDTERRTRYLAFDRESGVELLRNVTELIDKRRKALNSYSYGGKEISSPHYLVVVADLSALTGNLGHELCANQEDLGLSTIFLASAVERLPKNCALIAELDGGNGRLYRRTAVNEERSFRSDSLQAGEWESFLRRLAPIRLENPRLSQGIPERVTFLDTYGVTAPEELNIAEAWRNNRPEKTMAVPLGKGEDGSIEYFDIHSDAEGTHGLFVGGTSSGKSTMVRAWVLSMAANFSPERVNFVLVDFKETGLLTGLRELPHVTGTVGKLDRDIERNLTALKSEISRRERLFSQADSINIRDYLKKHQDGKPEAKEPMAFLYIVVDELNEFKMWSHGDAGNNWMSLLDQLYQTGSSLGIHVIAGSQTPGPFSPVMLANTDFRWCLRTNEAADSKTMLGSDIAYGLSVKGRAFVAVGTRQRELQPMYADAPYYTPEERQKQPEQELALVGLQGERRTASAPEGYHESELEKLTEHIRRVCRRQRITPPEKLWPPPLAEELPYPAENRGKSLCALVGVVDDPAQQSQYPLVVELEKSGSFLVHGAVQTGKTTFLQTFAFSLLENTPPEALEMYIIENNPGEFRGFDAYPQLAMRSDPYSCAGTIKALGARLDGRLQGAKEETKILLLIDNIAPIFTDHRTELMRFLQQGPSQGIYVAASATAGGGGLSAITPLMKTGFCLWVSESAYDYSATLHSAKPESIPPRDIPGRGLANIGRIVSFQTYRLPEGASEDFLHAHAEKRWGKRQSRKTVETPPGVVVLGSDGKRSLTHDFNESPSLLILWDREQEREALLAALGTALAKSFSCEAVITGYTHSDIPGAQALQGEELDNFLDRMRPELSRRAKAEEKSERPYLFLLDHFPSLLRGCTETSVNRVDKNLLLNAKRYHVLSILGCSYEEFAKGYTAEEGGSAVPLHRAATGKVLLLEARPDCLPLSLMNKGSIELGKSYYLGDKISEIERGV